MTDYFKNQTQFRLPTENPWVLSSLRANEGLQRCLEDACLIVASQSIGLTVSDLFKPTDVESIAKIKKMTSVASDLYGDEYSNTLNLVRSNMARSKVGIGELFVQAAKFFQDAWSNSVFESGNDLMFPSIESAALEGGPATLAATEVLHDRSRQVAASYENAMQARAVLDDTKTLYEQSSIEVRSGMTPEPVTEAVLDVHAMAFPASTEVRQDLESKMKNSSFGSSVRLVTALYDSLLDDFSASSFSFIQSAAEERRSGHDVMPLVNNLKMELSYFAKLSKLELKAGFRTFDGSVSNKTTPKAKGPQP